MAPLSHEPLTINNRLINELFDYILQALYISKKYSNPSIEKKQFVGFLVSQFPRFITTFAFRVVWYTSISYPRSPKCNSTDLHHFLRRAFPTNVKLELRHFDIFKHISLKMHACVLLFSKVIWYNLIPYIKVPTGPNIQK